MRDTREELLEAQLFVANEQISKLTKGNTQLRVALESAQRLLRENHEVIRNNLKTGYESNEATKVMSDIREALKGSDMPELILPITLKERTHEWLLRNCVEFEDKWLKEQAQNLELGVEFEQQALELKEVKERLKEREGVIECHGIDVRERDRTIKSYHATLNRQAEAIEHYVLALERLSRLGNGSAIGNSEGNTIAAQALNFSKDSSPVAPILGNWMPFSKIFSVIMKSFSGEWSWLKNSRCKYITLRIDMRNAKCLLRDREDNEISIENFEYQIED